MAELTITIPQVDRLPFTKAMRAADAAVYLDVSVGRIARLCQAGRLRSFKVADAVWIDLDAVHQYRQHQIAKRRVRAGS